MLDGQRLQAVEAYGKHMFLGFAPATAPTPREGDPDNKTGDPGLLTSGENLTWLHIHLGIYGSWRFSGDLEFNAQHTYGLQAITPGLPPGQLEEIPLHFQVDDSATAPHEHFADRWFVSAGDFEVPEPYGTVRLRLLTKRGVADLSGPNTCELLDATGVQAVLDRLGPDPLRPDSKSRDFVNNCAKRKKNIGEALMDQAVIAGVGNIYRAEVLYAARLNPFVPARDVSQRKLLRMWDWLEEFMPQGVETGRITTASPDDYATFVEREIAADRQPETIDSRYYVYQRQDRPCLRCATPVRLKVVAGRKLYWCPRCQR